MATWCQSPYREDTEGLVDSNGIIIALVEDFGYACYPTAINAATGQKERGGSYQDRVQAKLWAERVAGEHPLKPGDERPPFYYNRGSDK